MQISNQLDQAMIARRLMLHAQRMEERRKGKLVEEKTALEELEEDRALLSGNAPAGQVEANPIPHQSEETVIRLPELIARLKESNGTSQPVSASLETVVERQASLRYTVLERVDGLVRRSQTLAETDRYRFDFSDGITFKITDKWSNRSTTIWGDPHVDVSDVEGNLNGEFSDLKGSETHTTLMLQDGTRVTFTALDHGVIEAVDLFKGDQHLGGIGAASKQWSEKSGLFAARVETSAEKSASLTLGDTVYAGGDGNDWFTANGKLLWGQTTAPAPNARPYAVLQFEYQERISQQLKAQAA